MFRKKKTGDFVKEQRSVLAVRIGHARKMLASCVKSTYACAQLLTILPENSEIYKQTEEELQKGKQDILEWIASYESCRTDLEEFCKANNLRQAEWKGAYYVCLSAIKEKL